MKSLHFSKIKLLIAIQPIFFIFTLQTCFISDLDIRHLIGTPVLGFLLGLGLLYMIRTGKVDIKTNSIERTIFLVLPFVFWPAAFFAKNANTNLFFLIFGTLWLFSITKMYIRGNADDAKHSKIMFFGCTALIVLFILTLSKGLPFSPDSYSYYDISKNIFRNFGEISTVRQYVELSDSNLSFPWLYPAMINIVDNMTGFGMFSGVFINMIIAVMTFLFLLKISRRISGSYIPGILTCYMLFTTDAYLDELAAARAVPAAILCAVLVISVFTKWKPYAKKDIFLAGLAAGAGLAIRFDFLAAAGLTGLLLFPLFKKKAFVMAAFYGLGILIFASPWIIYSVSHFGTIWASDNAGTMFMTYVAVPQRFFLPEETVPTLFTDLSAWFEKVWNSFLTISKSAAAVLFKPVDLMLLGLPVYIFTTTFREQTAHRFKDQPQNFLLLSVGLIYLIKTTIIVFVGYGDFRYHAETMAVLFITLLSCAYLRFQKYVKWKCFLALLTLILFIQITPAIETNLIPKLGDRPIKETLVFATQEEKSWTEMLRNGIHAEQNKNVRVFFLDNVNAYRYGALLDIHSYAFVEGKTKEKLLYLCENFIKPDYINFGDPAGIEQWKNDLADLYIFENTTDPNTFKVTRTDTQPG